MDASRNALTMDCPFSFEAKSINVPLADSPRCLGTLPTVRFPVIAPMLQHNCGALLIQCLPTQDMYFLDLSNNRISCRLGVVLQCLSAISNLVTLDLSNNSCTRMLDLLTHLPSSDSLPVRCT